MGKSLIVLLSCWLYVGVVSAQGGAGDEQVWRLIKEDLERTQSVYITDSSIYCRVLSYMADTSRQQLAYRSETYLIDYGNIDLIRKYATRYRIQWEEYPLLQAIAVDTIQPNPKYPSWVNAMLGDRATIERLIAQFEASEDFAEKKYCVDCLLRRYDKAVFAMLIDEYRKNVYYYDRHNYECYSSRYLLVYWLRHIFSEEPLFRGAYQENIENIYAHYISVNEMDDGPIYDFAKRNESEAQRQYIRRVEAFVKQTFGEDIDTEGEGPIWFYYAAEIE